ncbi:MAG: hypothetical protein WCD18_03530, partial [Thermosynechococcaceae cyanobacterium]
FLTVAVLTVLVGIYWFFSSLTAPKPMAAKPPLPKPVASPVAQRPATVPSAVPSPKVAPTIAPAPRPVVTAPSPKPSVAVAPSPKPSPVPSVAPNPVASPTLDLAAIQTQLASAVADAGENLIASIQSLDANGRLRVTVAEGWSSLSTDNQRKVAQTLWQRSQKLNYNKFELRDQAGQLVARSPLVGPNVILFNRPSA